MTYKEFTKLVDQTYNNFNWRYGQSVMNVLYSVWQEKYNELMSEDMDCYDNEDKVKKVLQILESSWKS